MNEVMEYSDRRLIHYRNIPQIGHSWGKDWRVVLGKTWKGICLPSLADVWINCHSDIVFLGTTF